MNAPTLLKNALMIIALMAGFWGASGAQARWMEELYTGEAEVASVGQVDPQAQLRALDEVLFRLTGITAASDRLNLSPADLPSLIQSRQIIEHVMPDPMQGPVRVLRERIEFDPLAIDGLLADQNLKRWGRERASVLVWAVMEEDFSAVLLHGAELERVIDEAGRAYGLDLIRPLGDALDLSEISLADIRGGFLDQSEAALARYGANAVLMLDVRPDEAGWLTRAFWRIDGLDGGQSFLAPTLEEALDDAFSGLLRAMIRRYAIDLNDDALKVQTIRLVGIEDPVQYAEVLAYLDQLSVIESVQLTSATSGALQFNLMLRGDNLIDVLAVGRTLEMIRIQPDGLIEMKLAY